MFYISQFTYINTFANTYKHSLHNTHTYTYTNTNYIWIWGNWSFKFRFGLYYVNVIKYEYIFIIKYVYVYCIYTVVYLLHGYIFNV